MHDTDGKAFFRSRRTADHDAQPNAFPFSFRFPITPRERQHIGLGLLLLTLLLLLTGAMSSRRQKNLQQASFFLSRSEMHQLAESGLAIATHDLEHNFSAIAATTAL